MATQNLKLHIGGQVQHPDWQILDVEARPEVDFVGDAADLSRFADESVEQIYASHVLEHFYQELNNEVHRVLREWYRVLKPGGQLFVSVPNLRTICWLYTNPALSLDERMFLLAVIYGGQLNAYDIHRGGYDSGILAAFLKRAGFGTCQMVPDFDMFPDSSTIRFLGHSISLNVIAHKDEPPA